MFFKNKSLVFSTQMTLVLLVYSENLQPYSVLKSTRDIFVYELFPRSTREGLKNYYTLKCHERKPSKCTVDVMNGSIFNTTIFIYKYISSNFKNTTGAFKDALQTVDFNNNVHLSNGITANYDDKYYYDAATDTLNVWFHEGGFGVQEVFHVLVSETVDRHQQPINIRFSVCNNTYNVNSLLEFGNHTFKTDLDNRDIYFRKSLRNLSSSSGNCVNTFLLNNAKTELVSSTPALTTLTTTTTTRATITTTTQKITIRGKSTVIPNQDVSIQGDTQPNIETTITLALLIIVVSLVVFVILVILICVLIYFCKNRSASGRHSSAFSERLVSQRHSRESTKTDAPSEEYSYCTPLEGVLEVPKPQYDYVIKENEQLTENDYHIVEDRRTNLDEPYLEPKEYHKQHNEDLTIQMVTQM
uniref:Uncharacterized protein LOC114337681 isoform X1 n=1 Tax=Diabrotica virgifera virgifera TaxID=50390 RepID=A0A6P7G4N6_DIAVI